MRIVYYNGRSYQFDAQATDEDVSFALQKADEEERRRAELAKRPLAPGPSPDVVAKQLRAAREAGVEPSEALINPDGVNIGLRQKQILDASPELQKWLSTDYNYALAHDDVRQLSQIETDFRSVIEQEGLSGPLGLSPFLMAGGRYLADLATRDEKRTGLPAIARVGVAGAGMAVEGAYGLSTATMETSDAAANVYARAFGYKDIQEMQRVAGIGDKEGRTLIDELIPALRKLSSDLRTDIQAIDPAVLDAKNNLERGIYSGATSFVAMLPGLATGGAAGALMVGGLTAGGQSYLQAREKGLGVSRSLAFGATQGSIEILTEMFPTMELFKFIKGGSPFVKSFLTQLGTDVVGEQFATLFQDANEWVTLEPEKTVAEFISERGNAAEQTLWASVFGTTLNTALGVALAGPARQKALQQAQAAQAFVANYQRLEKASSASALLARDKGTFEDYVRTVSDGAALYVDRQTLNQALAQNPELNEAFQQNTLLSEALQAPDANSIVALPLAAVLSTPAVQTLKEDFRPTADSLSLREAKQEVEDFQARAEQDFVERVQKGRRSDAERQYLTNLRRQYAQQARQSGMGDLGDNYVKAASAALVNMFATMADRMNITTAELFDRIPSLKNFQIFGYARPVELAGIPAGAPRPRVLEDAEAVARLEAEVVAALDGQPELRPVEAVRFATDPVTRLALARNARATASPEEAAELDRLTEGLVADEAAVTSRAAEIAEAKTVEDIVVEGVEALDEVLGPSPDVAVNPATLTQQIGETGVNNLQKKFERQMSVLGLLRAYIGRTKPWSALFTRYRKAERHLKSYPNATNEYLIKHFGMARRPGLPGPDGKPTKGELVAFADPAGFVVKTSPPESGSFTFQKLFDHPEVFDAYPQLKTARIVILRGADRANTFWQWNGQLKGIRLTKKFKSQGKERDVPYAIITLPDTADAVTYERQLRVALHQAIAAYEGWSVRPPDGLFNFNIPGMFELYARQIKYFEAEMKKLDPGFISSSQVNIAAEAAARAEIEDRYASELSIDAPAFVTKEYEQLVEQYVQQWSQFVNVGQEQALRDFISERVYATIANRNASLVYAELVAAQDMEQALSGRTQPLPPPEMPRDDAIWYRVPDPGPGLPLPGMDIEFRDVVLAEKAAWTKYLTKPTADGLQTARRLTRFRAIIEHRNEKQASYNRVQQVLSDLGLTSIATATPYLLRAQRVQVETKIQEASDGVAALFGRGQRAASAAASTATTAAITAAGQAASGVAGAAAVTGAAAITAAKNVAGAGRVAGEAMAAAASNVANILDRFILAPVLDANDRAGNILDRKPSERVLTEDDILAKAVERWRELEAEFRKRELEGDERLELEFLRNNLDNPYNLAAFYRVTMLQTFRQDGAAADLSKAQNLLATDPAALGLTPEQVESVNPIYRPGEAGLPKEKLKNGKEAARWVERYFSAPFAAIRDFKAALSSDQIKHVATIMAAEAQLALLGSGHAGDWYSGALRRTIGIVSRKYPMLADEQAAIDAGFGSVSNARFVFTFILAVTSQNLTVSDNARATLTAWDQMLERIKAGDYSMSADWGTGDKQAAMGLNFEKFGKILKELPGETFPERLSRMDSLFREKKTVREWVKDLEAQNIPYNPPGQTNTDAVVYGSSILGPKIGNGFWQNLNENFSPLTIDLWMRRTWGRLTGKSIGNPEALPAQRARLKEAVERSRSKDHGNADLIAQVDVAITAAERRLERLEFLPLVAGEKKSARAAEIRTIKADIDALREARADYANIQVPEKFIPADSPARVAKVREELAAARQQLEALEVAPIPRGQKSARKAEIKKLRADIQKLEAGTGDEALLAYSRRLVAAWNAEYKRIRAPLIEKYGPKVKVPDELQPTWARAAKTIVQNLGKPLDQVQNGTQRLQIERAGALALQLLADRGITLTMADLQAALWYPEKELWNALTAELITDEDGDPIIPPSQLNESYDTVFARLLGVDYGEAAEGPRPGEGGAGAVAGPDVGLGRPEDAQGLRPVGGEDTPGAAGAGETLRQEKLSERPQQPRAGDGRRTYSSGGLSPLEGAPAKTAGPDPSLVAVAEDYAAENGIALRRPARFAELNEDRARRIATAFEEMQHAPNDPAVREAYEDLKRQTRAQYEALVAAGYVFTFYDGDTDPYDGNPMNAMRDLRNNKRMAVYGTYSGYGTEGVTDGDRADNPMLEDTGLQWPDQNGVMQPVTSNDLFRAVHDAFGHGLEGAGFRAQGEENAWQAHRRLYTGPALAAATTELRGQNSWLNYGPYAETNRTAKVKDTVFAENKIGLMPEWTWTEGVVEDMPAAAPEPVATPERKTFDFGAALEKYRAEIAEAKRGAQVILDDELVQASSLLSDQQFEIFKLARDGMATKDIADAISIRNIDLGRNPISSSQVSIQLGLIREKGFDPGKRAKPLGSELTLKVVELAAQGLKPKQIAEQLGYADDVRKRDTISVILSRVKARYRTTLAADENELADFAANYDDDALDMYATQGLAAAVVDPETGLIYAGMGHADAIATAPPDVQARLQRAYDDEGRGSDSVGFVLKTLQGPRFFPRAAGMRELQERLLNDRFKKKGSLAQAQRAGYAGQNPAEAAEYLAAVAKGLPMDQASRMRRAREMGFDTETVWYHGTNNEFSAFELGKHQGASAEVGRPGLGNVGVYFAETENVKRAFGDNLVKAYIRGKQKTINTADLLENHAEYLTKIGHGPYANAQEMIDDYYEGDLFSAISMDDMLYEEARRAWKEGYDSLRLSTKPYRDTSGVDLGDLLVVKDPSNIRSVHAAFDPDQSGSANLLAQEVQLYSPLLRAVENSRQNAAPPAQWLAMFYDKDRNASKIPGVKVAELQWSSVLDWLGSEQDAGAKSITKAEVIDFLSATVPRVVPVVRRGVLTLQDKYEKLSDAFSFLTDAVDDLFQETDDKDLEDLSGRLAVVADRARTGSREIKDAVINGDIPEVKNLKNKVLGHLNELTRLLNDNERLLLDRASSRTANQVIGNTLEFKSAALDYLANIENEAAAEAELKAVETNLDLALRKIASEEDAATRAINAEFEEATKEPKAVFDAAVKLLEEKRDRQLAEIERAIKEFDFYGRQNRIVLEYERKQARVTETRPTTYDESVAQSEAVLALQKERDAEVGNLIKQRDSFAYGREYDKSRQEYTAGLKTVIDKFAEDTAEEDKIRNAKQATISDIFRREREKAEAETAQVRAALRAKYNISLPLKFPNQYKWPGGRDQVEIIATMPGQIQPWKADDLHFPEDGTTLGWVRGHTYDSPDGSIFLMDEIQTKRFVDEDAPTDAPYTGDGWSRLAIKLALKHAVESGASFIALQRGGVVAQRWKMSNFVRKISYDPATEILTSTALDGREQSTSVPPADLHRYVGVDRAKTLLAAGKEATIEGKNIDIGMDAEKRRRQYDVIFRNNLAEAVKPFGGKLEEGELPDGSPVTRVRITPEMAAQVKEKGLALSQRARGEYLPITNPSPYIMMHRSMNFSTFLHEMGHLQLDIMMQLAAMPDAPAAVKQDAETVLAWFRASAPRTHRAPLSTSLNQSLRRAAQRSAEERASWFDDSVRMSMDFFGTQLEFRDFPDLRVALEPQPDGSVDATFTFDDAFRRPENTRVTVDEIDTATQIMARALPAIQEWMVRERPEYVSFSGASPAHSKVYAFMLGMWRTDEYTFYRSPQPDGQDKFLLVRNGARPIPLDGFQPLPARGGAASGGPVAGRPGDVTGPGRGPLRQTVQPGPAASRTLQPNEAEAQALAGAWRRAIYYASYGFSPADVVAAVQASGANVSASSLSSIYSQRKAQLQQLLLSMDLPAAAEAMGLPEAQARWLLTREQPTLRADEVPPPPQEEGEPTIRLPETVEDWLSMSLEEQRPFHELFARGFEAYLLEGRPPTPELKGLYAKFADWIGRVYKEIASGQVEAAAPQEAGGLAVQLSDDVRGVMDRLAASEQEIAKAGKSRAFTAVFRSAEEAGMTKAEWDAYENQLNEARDEAALDLQKRSIRDMRWINRLRDQIRGQRNAETNRLRREMKNAVAAELAQQPLYRAFAYLSRGIGAPEKTNFKLQRAALVERFGKALVDRLPAGPYGVVSATGSIGAPELDGLADTFGYSSGEALLNDLADMIPLADAVEAETDARMLEKHGDLSSPEAVAIAIAEAMHGRVRMRVLATELNALLKMLGRPAELLEAVKATAQRRLGAMRVRDVKPARFMTAAESAARAAEAGLRKIPREGRKLKVDNETSIQRLNSVIDYKRAHLINARMAREAVKINTELAKARKFFDRVLKGSNEDVAKRRDVNLVLAARALLAAYGQAPAARGKKATEYLALVQAYNPEIFAELNSLVAEALLSAPANPADITVQQMRDLHELVDQIYTRARNEKVVEIMGRQVEVKTAAEELISQLDELKQPKAREAGARRPVTEKDRTIRRLFTFRATLRRVESWARKLDLGKIDGPWQTYIFRPMSDAAVAYKNDVEQRVRSLVDILSPLSSDLLRGGKIDAPELDFTFNTKSELLHFLLHLGNPSNRKKLLLGYRKASGETWGVEQEDGSVTSPSLDAFLDRMHRTGVLTEQHWNAAQQIWDLMEDMKPGAQKAHKAVYGTYFSEITAAPVQTPFGTYRGGYVPAITEALVVLDKAQAREAENILADNYQTMFPTPAAGFTKGRVEDYTKPLVLDVASLISHVDAVAKFTHLAPAARQTARLIQNADVTAALNAYDPTAINEILIPFMVRTARQLNEILPSSGTERFFASLLALVRRRTSMVIMFANIVNTLQQVTGLIVAATRVNPARILTAGFHYLANPRGYSTEVMDASPFMRTRMRSQIYEMITQVQAISALPSRAEAMTRFFDRHTYFMQQGLQNVLDMWVWRAAYEEAIDKGADHGAAVRNADGIIRTTMGSTAPEDVSAGEVVGPFGKLFGHMTGYFNGQLNALATEMSVVWEQHGWRGAPQLGYIYFIGAFMPIFLANALALLLRGQWEPSDEEEENPWLWFYNRVLLPQIKFVLAGLPVIGPALNTGINQLNDLPYDDRISTPVFGTVERAFGGAADITKAIIDEDEITRNDVGDISSLISLLTGIPLAPISRPVGYQVGVEQGDISPTSELDYARGLVTGIPSEASR